MYTLCVSAGKCKPPPFDRSSSRPSYYSDSNYGNYPVESPNKVEYEAGYSDGYEEGYNKGSKKGTKDA